MKLLDLLEGIFLLFCINFLDFGNAIQVFFGRILQIP